MDLGNILFYTGIDSNQITYEILRLYFSIQPGYIDKNLAKANSNHSVEIHRASLDQYNFGITLI